MEKYSKLIEIKRQLLITEEILEDLLSSIWTAISYWANVDYNDDEYKKSKNELIKSGENDDDLTLEQVLINMMINGYPLIIIDYEGGEKYDLTIDKFINGIQKYLSSNDCHDYDINLEDYDDITVDGIVQYALFNEIIYG